MKPVLNKRNYFERWVAGEFGNRLSAWNTLEQLLSSGYTGNVSIRFVESCVFDVQHYVPVSEVEKRIIAKGWTISGCRFNESPNDNKLITQGEVVELEGKLCFLYSLEKLPMRRALETCSHMVLNLTARILLKHWLCPSSYSDLEALLELYPEHVIEFSTFSYNLGNIPNRNTIIWEVRKY